jgi:hypothetical protein
MNKIPLKLSAGIFLSLFLTLFITHNGYSQCNHQIDLYDTWGDGWNGATVTVNVNGVPEVVFTNPGTYPGECYFDVLDGNSNLLVNDWYPNTSGTWNGTGSCGAAPCPTCCTHQIDLYDTFGDGWNGATVTVNVNGIPVQTNITLAAGAGPGTFTFDAATGDAIQVVFTNPGTYPGECYFDVLDGNSNLLVNDWYPNTSGTWNGTGDCSAGPPPSGPPNDLCANATALPCATSNLAGTTVNASNIVNGTGCSMGDYGVWYTFVGDGSSTTISSVATFDHEMAIVSGSCGSFTNITDHEMAIVSGSCGSFTNITCQDIPAAGGTETYTFTTVNGTNYYVYISHYLAGNSTTGTFTISRTCAAVEMTVPTTGNNSYTVCSGNLYDNGGSAGNYNNSWNGYTVLYPSVGGNMVEVFGNTAGESCCDYLYIYNGVGIGAPLLWSGVAGSGAVPLQTSTDPTGALTVRFTSDGSVVGAGFDLTINCFVPCGVAGGTASASPTSVSACSNTTLTLVGHGGTIQWQASADGVTWNNIPGATSTPYVATVGGTTYYRAAVTSGCTSYSNSVTVTVAGSGSNYYVNDGSTAGDIYCTAIGSPANSGTVPCSPKASLQDVFDSYDIDPGDTIFVDAGTYTMGLDIVSADEGSAAGNVIIIGAGRSVTHTTAPVNDDNFYFLNVRYVTVRDMHIISTQASNYNYFIEQGTQNIIDNCLLESLLESNNTNIYYQSNGGLDIDENAVLNSTVNNTSAAGYNIWIDGDADNDTIRGCIINSTGTGGAKAVYLTDRNFGLSNMWPTSIHMYNNVVNSDDYGFYSDVVDGNAMEFFDIHDNVFNIQSSDQVDGAALYLMDHGLSSARISGIFNNRINGGTNGIYLTNSVDYVHFYNNYIAGSEVGIYVNDAGSNDNDLQHNSFYTTRECAYFNAGSNSSWNVRDNIFYTTGNSSYSCLYGSNFNTFITCDYNIFYAPNGANIANYNGSSYSTLVAWQGINHHNAAGNGDVNSFYTDPNYQSAGAGNLDLTGNYQVGLSIGTIAIDIYGIARTYPTIGAWERPIVLPVEIISFDSKCEENKTRVFWSTASEINNDFFQVEKSGSDLNFIEIGKVFGEGNSNSIINYSFLDTELNIETVYYRLAQVDYDGTTKYHNIIASNCVDNSFNVINPYLTNNNLNLLITSSTNEIVVINLYSSTGKLITKSNKEINAGNNYISLSNFNISSGIYMLSINGVMHSFSEKLLAK